MTALRNYPLLGVSLGTDVRFDEDEGPVTGERFEFRACTPRPIPDRPPVGEVLAYRRSGGSDYSIVRGPGTVTVRFHSTCDFVVDEALTTGTITPSPVAHPELPGLLLGGAVLSAMLNLRGRVVLHASAVEVGDRAIVFVGGSGSGKTTVAALLCAAGARLVADDTLGIVQTAEDTTCCRGSRWLRLRPGASWLASVAAAGSRVSFDGRVCVRPERMVAPSAHIGVIAMLIAAPSGDLPAVTRLTGTDSMKELLASHRLAGWRCPSVESQQLRLLASLARKTPVVSLRVPVASKDPQLGHAVLRELEQALN